MVNDNPYDSHNHKRYGEDVPRFEDKQGLLYAWQARALQYWHDKNPLKTYNSVDPHKINWTVDAVRSDLVGSLIGREWPSEEEIVESLDWRDKYITATFVKKSSDYVKIMPMDGARNASNINHPNQLERMIVHDRIANNYQKPYEVEGEILFERRTTFDQNYIWHLMTFGWSKWEPNKTKSMKTGVVGSPGDGVMRKEKPVSGPNIRGRYARDLRGDKDVLYEFTNTDDCSHLGSDLGPGHNNKGWVVPGWLPLKDFYLKTEKSD